jgi:hypothetical protein
MQNTLSSSFSEDDDHYDLEAELALMLSEDALVATRSKAHAKITLVEPLVHTHSNTDGPEASRRTPERTGEGNRAG